MATSTTRMSGAAATIALVAAGGSSGAANGSSATLRARMIEDGRTPAEIARVMPRSRVVAITFDDGPDPITTPQVLKILRDHRATATFFMIGAKVEVETAVAKQVVSAGHEIGNHTQSHTNLTKIDLAEVESELQAATEILERRLGVSPAFARPPGGQTNADVRQTANRLGLTSTLWSVNPGDCDFLSAREITRRALESIRAGDILLLHDTVPATVEALPAILQGLKKKGLKPVTLSELVRNSRPRT